MNSEADEAGLKETTAGQPMLWNSWAFFALDTKAETQERGQLKKQKYLCIKGTILWGCQGLFLQPVR